MSKHTPEPWFYHRQGFSTVYIEARIGGGMLQEIAACGPCQDGTEQQDENASRIVACVNACAGVSNGELAMTTMSVVLARMDEAEQQRDELLAALEFVMSAHGEQLDSAFAQAQNAISKARGV